MIPALLLSLVIPSAQDPVPPEVAPDLIEPEASPELADLRNQIQELIDTVREDFTRLGQALNGSREIVDRPEPDGRTLETELLRSVTAADVLLEDMEKLLEMLPQMENQNPSGGGRGPKPEDQQEPQENQDSADQPKNEEDGGTAEQMTGNQPEDLLRRMMLFDLSTGMWGRLPPRLQGALENANAEDLPLRYRRWLEEYHRRSAEAHP